MTHANAQAVSDCCSEQVGDNYFDTYGVWNQSQGVLVVSVVKNLMPGVTHALSFVLVNNRDPQDATHFVSLEGLGAVMVPAFNATIRAQISSSKPWQLPRAQ